MVLAAVSAASISACGKEGPTLPEPGPPGIRLVSGGGATDTIGKPLTAPLVVEVRGTNGQLASGVIVEFQAQPLTASAEAQTRVLVCTNNGTPCGLTSQTVSDTTDAAGLAQASIRLGAVAGRAVVRFSATANSFVDSATFTVTPGNAAAVKALYADTLIDIGGTVTVGARVVDRYGNLRTEAPVLTPGPENVISLNATNGAVTGLDLGAQWVFARLNTLVDSTRVRVLPGGRLFTRNEQTGLVLMTNVDGSKPRTVLQYFYNDGNSSFPHFDATGGMVTITSAQFTDTFGRSEDELVVLDTMGTVVQSIKPANGFEKIVASRKVANGMVLVVGSLKTDSANAGLYSIASNNAITLVTTLPGLEKRSGYADISPDGSRVAYLFRRGQELELRVKNHATGAVSVIDTDARYPQWSPQGDRIAFVLPFLPNSVTVGPPVVINADGTGRRVYGTDRLFLPGFTWSPTGAFLLGNSDTFPETATRLLRVRDGVSVLINYRLRLGIGPDFQHFTWR